VKISIVTPSFNQAPFIARTIDSVLDQRGDFELDYRVIDGGSTDGTLAILERYGARVRWTSEPDAGQVDAINKGLHAATGDVVGWLNSDDVLLPGALAKIAAAFDANPSAEWVHGRCMIIDEHDREVRRWISLYKHLRARTHTFENFLTENYVCQMTAFWRRAVHDDIGYLDASFRYAFDYDLWLRLAERGARHPAATAWTRARAHAKNAAIISIYRALAAARRLL
jgi:glycosyltransferase involved in cell wall biosynthesis